MAARRANRTVNRQGSCPYLWEAKTRTRRRRRRRRAQGAGLVRARNGTPMADSSRGPIIYLFCISKKPNTKAIHRPSFHGPQKKKKERTVLRRFRYQGCLGSLGLFSIDLQGDERSYAYLQFIRRIFSLSPSASLTSSAEFLWKLCSFGDKSVFAHIKAPKEAPVDVEARKITIRILTHTRVARSIQSHQLGIVGCISGTTANKT